jgi:hypothetical protein
MRLQGHPVLVLESRLHILANGVDRYGDRIL